MKKGLFVLFLGLLVVVSMVACNGGATFPECNEGFAEGCLIVKIANEHGVCLEAVGNALIVANGAAIGTGLYTAEGALSAVKEIDTALDKSLTDIAFQALVNSKIGAYPGLIEISSIYMSSFDAGIELDDESRAILQSWLRNRIVPILERYTAT